MSELTVVKPQQNALIGPEEIKVLRDSLFRGFTDAEVNYCVSVCKQLQLSPLLRHVHFVKRKVKEKDGSFKDVITTQTGIDGLRLAAQRSAQYAGSDSPVFEFNKENYVDKATVTIYRMVGGVRCPFVGEAYWEEFYPGDAQGAMWKKMPKNQLAKCAEAQALRKAFPAECSSLYVNEEMHQADTPSKAAQVQARILKETAIETTATEVSDANEDAVGAAPEMPTCAACGEFLMKSAKKPVLYCKNWQKKEMGEHSVVSLDGGQ